MLEDLHVNHFYGQDYVAFYQEFLQISREFLNEKIRLKTEKVVDKDLGSLIKINFYLAILSHQQSQKQENPKDYKHFSIQFTEDVYECLSIGDLTIFFDILDKEWTTFNQVINQFFLSIYQLPESDKFILLKIGNAILKRLSRAHETEIRGRIHIFLTKIFSICHKSGISKKVNEKDYTIEEDEQDSSQNRDLPYSLYKNFWILQQFLNQPDQIQKIQVEFVQENGDQQSEQHHEQGEQKQNDKAQGLQSIMRIILRILHYFKEHPINGKNQGPVKRFPKFLTKYSLFKDQLGDPVFRKIILTQILLFSFTLRLKQGQNKEDEKLLLSLDEQINQILIEMNEDLGVTINKLIETEKIWLLWRERSQGQFEQPYDNELNEALKVSAKQKFLNRKGLDKKKEIIKRIQDDMKFKSTSKFNEILKGKQVFEVSTNALEPGLNYYLNDIIEEMNSSILNEDKAKSYKDYAWKTLRVIARFFVQELKIITLNNIAKDEKLPDLEEIVRLIITSAEKLDKQQRIPQLQPIILSSTTPQPQTTAPQPAILYPQTTSGLSQDGNR